MVAGLLFLSTPVFAQDSALGDIVDLYGFVRLDVVYDENAFNDTHTPWRVQSGDLDGDMTFHTRLTRFGLKLTGGAIEDLNNAELTGKIEVDFYGNQTSDSRHHIRMRKAYLQLDWTDWNLLFGQTSDLISPLYPVVNNDMVMWGAGNLGDRRPQIRAEYRGTSDDSTWFLQGMLGLTGAIDNDDLDANGILDGEQSQQPTFQGRVAWHTPLVEDRQLKVGLWFHVAEEEVATAVAGKTSFDSSAFGLDFEVPIPFNGLTAKGELWSGENVDDLRGAILQGVNTANGEEIEAVGGWLELVYPATENWMLHVGYSFDDPDDDELASGDPDENNIFYVGNRFKYAPLTFGFDILLWETEYVTIDEGESTRINFFASYSF
jgi:hypothetical protein